MPTAQKPRYVIWNGTKVAAGWPEMILKAQQLQAYEIDGRSVPRIPYGRGRRLPSATCGDCAVRRGQLHVPGCDLEVCPECGGQAITCGCIPEGIMREFDLR
jgi:hypothetical protein